MIEIGQKYIISLDSWFAAPNGKSYISVFGTVKQPQAGSGLIPIGNTCVSMKHIISIIRTDKCELGDVEDWSSDNTPYALIYNRPSKIYNSDEIPKTNNVMELVK